MPIRIHTGFETSDDLGPEWLTTGGSAPTTQAVATDQAYSGSRSAKFALSPNDNWAAFDLFTISRPVFYRNVANDPIAFGAALRVSNLANTDYCIIGLASMGSTELALGYLTLRISPDGSASFVTSTSINSAAAGTLGTLPAGTFISDEWYYIEVRAESWDNTTGSAQVWVNGILVIDVSGVDTNGSSSGNPGGFGWSPVLFVSSTGLTSVDVWVDDVYAGDDMAVLGPVHHEALFPISTVEADGIGSDADSIDNHLLVDNLLGTGADYVDLSQTDRARFEFADRTLTGAVLAVSLHGAVSNPDPGVVTANGFLLSNATEIDGAPLVLSSASNNAGLIVAQSIDPDTATAWTTSGVNAITAGVEVAA